LTALKDMQAAIIAELQKRLTTIDAKAVESYPDPGKEFTLKNPKGAVLVHYNATGFGSPMEMLDITQDGRMSWLVYCVTRSLVGNGAVLDLLDDVRKALTGLRPVGGQDRYLYPVREGFVERDEALWWYVINFELVRNHRQERE